MSPIILSYLAGLAGLALGLFAIVTPHGAARLVGIQIDASLPQSISEVRATYGGVFAGGHGFSLLNGSDAAFLTLACGWGLAGVVRIGSMLFDRAANGPNYGGTAFELAMAGLLAAPILAR